MKATAVTIAIAIAAVFLAGCSAPGAASGSSAEALSSSNERIVRTPRETLDAGVQWLIEHQNPDGSFGSFSSARPYEIYLDNLSSHRAFHVATSALCTAALIEPATRDADAAAALEKGLDWIVVAPLTARATGSTFYDVWAHTYLLELAARVMSDSRLAARHDSFKALAEREVRLSLERQASNGGWGYYDFGEAFLHPTGHLSTSFNTAAMILALRAVEEHGVALPPSIIRDGVLCLRRMQLPSGSYSYGIYVEMRPQAGFNQVRGASGRLQVCNLALYREAEDDSGSVDLEGLARGLELLREHHHYIAIGRGRPVPHEAYYSNSGYYYYFGHYYAARVAAQLGPGSQRRDLATWLAGVFVADQYRDGSWFDYPLYGYGHAYATGYAVLSMSELMPLLDSPAPMAATTP